MGQPKLLCLALAGRAPGGKSEAAPALALGVAFAQSAAVGCRSRTATLATSPGDLGADWPTG